jgi:NAD(P)H-dependent FMN reductase
VSDMRILGFAGSLRRVSYNRGLIRAAVEHFDQDGNLTDPVVRTSLVELLDALHAWTVRIDLRREAA